MLKVIMLCSIITLAMFGLESAMAASGKCIVEKVDGTRMVIHCNSNTTGFSQGNQIKIKSDKKVPQKD